MKVCEVCGCEIWTRDGDNRCAKCDDIEEKSKPTVRKRVGASKERDQVMRDLGLVKVRGALGGTYWE